MEPPATSAHAAVRCGKMDKQMFQRCTEITWKPGAESQNNLRVVKLAIKQIDFMQKLANMLGKQQLLRREA